ncbi:hypothetical protein [Enterococcus faecalis]|uniref:hypothetical protein n=1 Tax=Enterococcus faecalis TaxID=1351 RepID=UPI00035403DD|nr:hypothetical protein [Enterococcus faecalis]EPI39918.1 hypothetical protein D347_00752 [Enterococcus faecalis LA3B-2]
MFVTDFAELAEVMMKRKRIQLKDIAEFIGTSSVYARQVIEGHQRGEKADFYKLKIADFLDIDRKYANVKQPT